MTRARQPHRPPCWLLVVTALVAVAGPAAATAAGPPLLDGWRSAPLWGADVRSVAIHPEDPDLLFAGTSAGQVYISRDAGASWAATGPPGALAGWVISDLVIDPEQPSRLWAALWGVWGGGGVLASDDLGVTWTPRGEGLPGSQVYALAPVPGRAGALYAGTRGGVYGTADGGGSWRRLTGALPEIEKVTSLLVDPRSPDTVIAGTWRRAYRSDDAGATWRGVFDGMWLDSEVFSLRRAPGRPDEVWASTCGWVYRSVDGGESWTRFKEGLPWRRTPSFAVLPEGRLLAGTVGGLFVSDDGGTSWRRSGGGELAVLDIAYHPERPRRVVLGTEGSGVWISEDGGETLTQTARGMTNLRVGALARVGRELLVAVNHAGPASGIYSSRDGGDSFLAPETALPTVLALTVAGPQVFAGTEEGLYERSGDGWRRVTELGERRIEALEAAGERLLARTPGAVFELVDGRFRPAVADTAAAPAGSGRYPTGDPRHPALVVGSESAHLLTAGGDVSAVPGAAGNGAPPPGLRFALPVPADDITAAAVVDGRLLLGTSGHGLLITDLPTSTTH